jgi:hypothetical protein
LHLQRFSRRFCPNVLSFNEALFKKALYKHFFVYVHISCDMTDTQSTFGGNDAWIVTTSPLVASKHAETPRGIAKALKFSLLPYLPGATRGAACDLNPWFWARSQAWWSFELTLPRWGCELRGKTIRAIFRTVAGMSTPLCFLRVFGCKVNLCRNEANLT